MREHARSGTRVLTDAPLVRGFLRLRHARQGTRCDGHDMIGDWDAWSRKIDLPILHFYAKSPPDYRFVSREDVLIE